jgi:outer membrane murein-binding lipoprotein Lpp
MGRWIVLAAALALAGCDDGGFAKRGHLERANQMTNARIDTLVERANRLEARIEALELENARK